MDNDSPPPARQENSQPEPETQPIRINDTVFSPRGILSLAIPALGSLVIEPLLITIDSIMVGHLGTTSLAGLSLASTILNTLVGVFVFLAYSTTALAAKMFGAGQKPLGLKAGVDAIWLSVGLGIILVTALEIAAPSLVIWLGANPQVATLACGYLRAGAPGMIGMLVILATTGTLRGLLDTKTPLYVLAWGAIFNVGINFWLIYGLGWGLVGAGIGLSITQTLMAVILVHKVMRGARDHQVSLRPTFLGMRSSLNAGIPLFIRTVSLRIALLATVAVAAQAGTETLAAHQVVNSLWTMAAFSLDALAIAAQSLTGVALGAAGAAAVVASGQSAPDAASDTIQATQLRHLIRRLSWWGVLSAAIIGAFLVVTAPWVPRLFGADPQMQQIATTALIAAGILLPIGGLVFILDGVLIGASQGPYLAKMGLVTLAFYLPVLWWLNQWIVTQAPLNENGQKTALLLLWISFSGWFMLLRAISNGVLAFSTRKIL